MINLKNNSFKLATAGVMAFALTGLLAPATASAALVTGNATIAINNTAFAAANFYTNIVEKHWGASDNNLGITGATTGGTALATSGPTAMLFPVNTNLTTTACPSCGPYGRTEQATNMDASNTSVGQIGLSGAWRINGPGGVLTPYDFRLVKTGSTWNISTFDTAFGFQNFLTLASVSETLNGSGQLLLSGDLKLTGLWAALMGANTSAVVGTFNLAPAAVPVPAAVWMFLSGMIGLLGAARRKTAIAA